MWFIVTVDNIGEGNEDDERFRCSFLCDDSFVDLKLSKASYGLREQHWGRRGGKSGAGWMFLRPTKDIGGQELENAQYLRF